MTTQQPKNTTADAGQNREQLTATEICGSIWKQELSEQAKRQVERDECRNDNSDVLPAKSADAHAAGAHDRWEQLREKLSIGQAQYLNTYIKTGDIAVLNSLVLGIILQRDETAAERDRLRNDLNQTIASNNAEILSLREQVKTLATVLGNLIGKIEEMSGCMPVNYEQGNEECYPEFDAARAAIKSVESEGQ